MQRAVACRTDIVAGVAKGFRFRTIGGNAPRLGKIYHSKYEAVIFESRPSGNVYSLAFQVSVSIISPRFVNHTGYEVEGKGGMDIVPTTFAKTAEPTERAKDVEGISQGVRIFMFF